MTYSISGTVKESTTIIERTVRLYDRSTGVLVDSTTSTSGEFSFTGLTNIEYQVICLDDSDGTEYNDLIYRVYPVESIGEGGYTAKSAILDIADNWGDNAYVGVRQIDFYYQESKIELTYLTDFEVYATTYATGSGFEWLSKYAFDASTSYIGRNANNSWLSDVFTISNQRLIIVFNTEIEFDSIVINNFHGDLYGGGNNTDRGIKNTKIYISTDEITDTTYNALISNSTLIFDDEIRQHISSDVQDNEELTLIT